MNVYLYASNGGEDNSADLTGDLGGLQREPLIRALCIYLKGALSCQLLGQILLCKSDDAVHILLADGGAVYTYDAEYLFSRVVHTVHIAHIVKRLYVDGGLLEIYFKCAVGACSAAKLLYKLRFKALAVCAL